MRHIFLTVLFFLICSSAFTQVVNTTDTTTPKAFSYVEQMPVPGYNFMGYIKKNIHYPETAIKNGTEGRVILKFIVNEDGRISDCNVLRGLDSACNEESIRLIMTMPAWNPGKQNGKAVKVYYTQTIAFKLPGKNNLDEDALPDKNRVYNTADQMPAPVYDLNEYISEAIFYPDSARMKHISGKVVVSFVVNEDGTISDCDVSSGIGAGCDEEALRVIRTMPAWEPGTIKGIPVKVALAQPITFDLKGYDLNKDSSLSINKVYTYVDRMPSADYLLSTYLTSYIHYPEYARDHNQQGRAVTQFVVNEDGSLTDIKVKRSVSWDIDKEALRVVKLLPKFIPGKQQGKAVKVLFDLPISFRLS